MHTNVNELHGIVEYLRNRRAESHIVKYADYDLLAARRLGILFSDL